MRWLIWRGKGLIPWPNSPPKLWKGPEPKAKPSKTFPAPPSTNSWNAFWKKNSKSSTRSTKTWKKKRHHPRSRKCPSTWSKKKTMARWCKSIVKLRSSKPKSRRRRSKSGLRRSRWSSPWEYWRLWISCSLIKTSLAIRASGSSWRQTKKMT